jgi:hypothetical protein
MLVIPQFTLIHPYLHLLIMAPLLVFVGCERALTESQKGAASQVRTSTLRALSVQLPDLPHVPLAGRDGL